MSQLAAGLRISLLEHFKEILGVDGILLFLFDLRCHLLQHGDQCLQTMLELRLACRVGFRRDLSLQLLRRGHALLRQRLDRVGLLLLLVIALSRGCDLPAEIVEVLLHRAQLRLAG